MTTDGDNGTLIKCRQCGREYGRAKPNSEAVYEVLHLDCWDCIEKEGHEVVRKARERIKEERAVAMRLMEEAISILEKELEDTISSYKQSAEERRKMINGLNWIERYDQ